MHNPEFGMAIRTKFSAEEAQQIIDFLDRDFSVNGELVVASIFLYAKENKKELADILKVCQAEWDRNWNFQHPDLRGNPDAPGAAGRQNVASLNNIYRNLGIPNPREEGLKIPSESMVVKTHNSIYKIGAANKNGERTIIRDGRQLGFSRGKVIFLAKGKSMHFVAVGADPNNPWETSEVESISIS